MIIVGDDSEPLGRVDQTSRGSSTARRRKRALPTLRVLSVLNVVSSAYAWNDPKPGNLLYEKLYLGSKRLQVACHDRNFLTRNGFCYFCLK